VWPFIVHREKLIQYVDALGYNYKCNFARLAVRWFGFGTQSSDADQGVSL
jgi:hypothetical protein